jgi:hypothetical protein
MGRFFTIIAVAATFTLSSAFAALDRGDPEAEAVRETIQYYLDGQAAGDGQLIARAFHPGAHLTTAHDGGVRATAISDYVSRFSGRPASDEDHRERWIESVDITGDAAAAKVILEYPDVRYTDYMSLLKVDGRWQIIHKNYIGQPR